MPTEVNGALPVVAGDVLALRGTGLAAAETWALLCQAAQALQDLFLSNGGVVGGSRAGPVVTPHTLELTPRGRVTLQLAPPETARAYLPPEYRPGRMYSDTDSEKMWMYSLGRALVDTTPRVAALTGSVSVSPTSALQSVLAAMTEPDPRRRASLMNLLDVISEYCRTRLQSKPFTHIVMDMYREVVRSSQYAARRRLAMQSRMINMKPQRHPPNHPQPPPPPAPSHYLKHQAKGNLFKSQSRNSRSHPNLQSLSGHEPTLSSPKPQFQSQMNIESINPPGNSVDVHHGRTNSQPVTTERTIGITQTRSNHNLAINGEQIQPSNNVYSDPIYALPVKPFLSSQDVRVNGLSAKSTVQRTDVYAQPVRVRRVRNGGSSQPNIAHLGRMAGDEVVYGTGRNCPPALLHRQYSNPQLPSRNSTDGNGGLRNHVSNQGVGSRLRVFTGNSDQQDHVQRNVEASVKGVHGPVPPKPPRIITSVNRPAAPLPDTNGEPPPKPPRNAIRNGPRARRGKPVQRAPSRLYRAITGPTRCLNKTQCVGPEFVVRANQPSKLLTVGDVKNGCGGRIVVILLTGQRIDVTCDPQKITAGELFQAIVQAESLDENFTLGLAALLAGDFAMLPPETKLNKVAPPGWLNSGKSKGPLGLPTSFMLYLRLRFFLPSLRGIRSWISKHLLYLQIRRCILEQQLVCPLTQLVNLTGLALQAEFGNYSVNEHGRGDYFLLEHYIPESLILNPDHQNSHLTTEALKSRLHQAHRDRRGLDANSAEEMFITHAQGLHDYGSHFYIATVDTRELEKIADRIKKIEANHPPSGPADRALYPDTDNIYQIDGADYSLYGKIEYSRPATYGNIEPTEMMKNHKDDIYSVPKKPSGVSVAEKNNNNISNNSHNKSRSKKSETNVWLAIHGQGLKLFERAGRPRERTELIRVQWRDIQTLSYSKNCLVVYTKFGGKRAKFKLRMDHKKSYYAFKLTSLHHQFFLKLKSELTSLQGLHKDFGVALTTESNSPKVKSGGKTSSSKISIAEGGKGGDQKAIPLEELQNKENENPQRDVGQGKCDDDEPVCYTPEEDALYAQVNARLEPEGASRDTEDEGERAERQMRIEEAEGEARDKGADGDYSYSNIGGTYGGVKQGSSEERVEVKHPEELYAAINKSLSKKNGYPTPEEVWDVSGKNGATKNLAKVKTSSLPNYGTPRQSTGFRTPSLPRRLGVKMGTRAIYSSLVQRDPSLADDLESLSLKSDTASSIQSASVHSTESPMPEAYVLNADIRTDDETFRIANDESMSASLVARLEELSFTEERILHTIKLERGHGGSIGLQVTEGNDGGVYVQAVSVGGSADMAGNVNKGDRIVAINGQSLLNLRYEDALKLLQSSSETVELVLSQFTSNRADALRQHHQEPIVNNYLQNLRFDISSEADVSGMTSKWLSHKCGDVASVQNTSSAYSSAASSAMGNHNINVYQIEDGFALNSASMLLSIEDFDVSRTSRQVFI
ncbi:uncharacterized protein LOC107035878 [Diachasma alloeum]|uniref:uncharacterized protein LOC107035878 n=1 Tax=Diachasma alloeum TaxID=454923 RepID=UPI0007384854|nr:uncharacterized protein LOC107035878 [Diachasma alloeum]